ncbi:MAG: glycine oxidase ThiO [Ktedonobacteraceae bacterium]|nr:glycine oxidase ThiO [Ktedonobacteraceae bacterium]
MKQTTEIAIIGGGVIGCAIAYQLIKAGFDVSVLERAEIAAEASSAAAGLLAPERVLTGPRAGRELFLASWSITADLIAEVQELSGVHVEYQQTGALHTITNAEEESEQQKHAQAWRDYGLDVTWLRGDEVRQYEPLLNQNIDAALYFPYATSIRPRLLTKAYAEAARKLGAHIHEQTEVIGFTHSSGKVTGVQTAKGEIISCERVVIATGAWSAQIGKWLSLSIPVTPARGQILALQQPATPLTYTIFGKDLYMVPKVDKTIHVGATLEHVGFDKSNTAGGIAWLLSGAIELLPMLEHVALVQMWAGLRPLSSDAYPILGKAPGWENVILATGHGRAGFELSAITSRTITELMLSGETPVLIQPFGLERFSTEDLGGFPGKRISQ